MQAFVVSLGVNSRNGECSVIDPLEDGVESSDPNIALVTLDITYALEEDDQHGDRLRVVCEVREESVKISERAKANLNATIEGLDL